MEPAIRIEIWFFIGLLLFVYGLLIFGAGFYDLVYPPVQPTAMSQLHPAIWWGALLILLGLYYVVRFRPRRKPSV
jgi:FtsH-binding integral membrane protein